MKTLHLLRHAKSAWDEPGLGDRQRGLNARGRRDAPAMGRALAGMLSPQPVHHSPARRAVLTLAGVCEGWPALANYPHQPVETLYTFDADDLLDWLAVQDDQLAALFLVGHNPAFTDLANALCGDWVLDNLPTAGYLRLSLGIEAWGQLGEGSARLEHRLFPRELSS